MAVSRTRSLAVGRFTWLLWVVLLLPLAQAATLWHGLSHVTNGVQEAHPAALSSEEPLSAAGHCALCLTAASIHGGALPSAPISFAMPAVLQPRLPVAFVSVWMGSFIHPYRSRAPPVSR